MIKIFLKLSSVIFFHIHTHWHNIHDTCTFLHVHIHASLNSQYRTTCVYIHEIHMYICTYGDPTMRYEMYLYLFSTSINTKVHLLGKHLLSQTICIQSSIVCRVHVCMYVCVNYTLCTCMVGTCAHLHVVLHTTSTSTTRSTGTLYFF